MYSTFRNLFGGCASLLLMVLVTGCGAGSNPASVTGTVTYNGEPITSGRVMFVNDDQPSEVFIGLINERGQYELKMTEGIAGAVVGTYRVAVLTDESSEMDEFGQSKPMANTIPQKYKNPETSGLTANISEGKNVINFELADE